MSDMGDGAVRQGGDGVSGKARGDWVFDRFRPHRKGAAIEKKRIEPSPAPRIVVRRAILVRFVNCHRNSESDVQSADWPCLLWSADAPPWAQAACNRAAVPSPCAKRSAGKLTSGLSSGPDGPFIEEVNAPIIEIVPGADHSQPTAPDPIKDHGLREVSQPAYRSTDIGSNRSV